MTVQYLTVYVKVNSTQYDWVSVGHQYVIFLHSRSWIILNHTFIGAQLCTIM